MALRIFTPKNTMMGLQLSPTSLKWMQLEAHGSKVKVKAYTHVDLPKNIISDDIIISSDSLAEFIKQSLRKATFGQPNTNRVAITLPESKSFVRVIHIPEMSETEVESTVLFEAEAYIPLPMDQVYFDWQILGRKDGRMEVLIIASPKDVVDKYIAVLEKAQLRVVAVEVESQSIARALTSPAIQETFLIVDIDSWKTNMIMIEKGNLQFTSSIPIGGSMFDKSIVQTLGVTPAEADKIKKQIGIDNTPEYPNVKTSLLPVLSGLSAEIKNIIKFHAEHSPEPIHKIILSGGTAKMKNLDGFLTEDFKDLDSVVVEIANPWQNIAHLDNPPLSEYEALGLTATIGAAMRNIYKP